jgi:hypothetical protein
MSAAREIHYDEKGLVPVVAQDASTSEVLMLAYASREAVEKTLSSGEAHYYSRSRKEIWRKGETSGNTRRSSKYASTATATRCSTGSSRRDPRATPARGAAFLPPSQTRTGRSRTSVGPSRGSPGR